MKALEARTDELPTAPDLPKIRPQGGTQDEQTGL
jgi:hypothetical protein